MTAATVVPFRFESHEIRTLIIDDQPWFVARDVCDVLELNNITEALRILDEDELTSEFLKSGGQEREMKIISESGLYTLILRSNKPQAKTFRKWVISEVLPAIRKTGSYQMPGAKPKSIVFLSREFHAALRLAKSNGLKNTDAILAANRFTKEQTGFSPAEQLGLNLSGLNTDKKTSGRLLVHYLNLLKSEWQAQRTTIQFIEINDQLEARITMRELLAEFNAIALRCAVKERYHSASQLAAKCTAEQTNLEQAGWSFTKTVKIRGIQRYMLTNQVTSCFLLMQEAEV